MLFIWQMTPEFENQGAVVRQQFLKRVDLVQTMLKLLFVKVSAQTVCYHLERPGATIDSHPPVGGQHSPVAPGTRPLIFFLSSLEENVGIDVSSVHPLVEPVTQLVTTQAIIPGDNDNDREVCLVKIKLGIE